MNKEQMAVREAFDFINFVEGGGLDLPGDPPSKEALLRAYKLFAEVIEPRRPRMPVAKMPVAQLIEETAFAALTVVYSEHQQKLFERLTPGRQVFEELSYQSPLLYALHEDYQRGGRTWPETVNTALREVLQRIGTTATELKVSVPEFPMPPDSMGTAERVAYLRVAYSLLSEYQAMQMKHVFGKETT